MLRASFKGRYTIDAFVYGHLLFILSFSPPLSLLSLSPLFLCLFFFIIFLLFSKLCAHLTLVRQVVICRLTLFSALLALYTPKSA